MEPIPLFPAINSITCPDTSHILREEFQEFLGHKKFPQKIAENLQDFNSQELQLKTCGTEVVHSYSELKTNAEEMTYAEKVVMTSQAGFLTQEKRKELTFKLEKIYPDIDEDVVQKYWLIKVEDIMPHITERIINCKMQPHDFIFKNTCLETKRNISELDKMECDEGKKCNVKLTPLQESNIRKFELFKSRRKKLKRKPKYNFTNKRVFVAEPNELVFSNYEKNVVYEQIFRLRNITAVLQTFRKPILSEKSKFSVKQHGENLKLAPGMCATFTVTFFVENLSNHFEENIVFLVPGSESITVHLLSWRDVPLVKGLIYYDDEKLSDKIRTPREKSDVYNYTIDCGATMFGCSKEMKFIVENCGGDGVFFILGEEDWENGEVNNICEDFKLKLQEFSLSPAFFELKENEIREIKIKFTPTQFGLCLDKIFLLCDSNTAEEIDIIGDCLFYEPYFLKLQMPECPFTPFKKPREPKNVLHLGAVYSSQVVTGFFSVYNTSSIPLSYEWRKNKYTKVKDFTAIQSDHINIYPNEGTFLPISETEFEVSVAMETSNFGLYKLVFSLYVLDILEKNLSEGPIFTFGEEYRNETFEKCLSIQVDKIEVQIHHIPLQIYIYPEDLTFPILFKNKSSVKTVRVVNDGFCCMSCEWIHDQGCGCQQKTQNQVLIHPQTFDLDKESFVECTMSVTPEGYDDVHETFVLSINRGYSAYSLQIHGSVEKPHIRVSHTFIDFGSAVMRDSMVTAVLYVENTSDCKLYWRVQEYHYHFESNSFVEECPCSLDSDCGVLCHKGSETRLQYMLNTQMSRKFLSILVFYTIYQSQLYESTHVILLATIKEPVVTILNDTYKQQVFSIYEEHFVNETITRSFYIHNDSPLKVMYAWGDPTGMHISFVSISFDTGSGRLYPWSRRCVQVTVTFLKPGEVHDIWVPCGVEALPQPVYLQVCCCIKSPQVVISIPSGLGQRYEDIIWPPYQSFRGSELCLPGEDVEELPILEYIPGSERDSMKNYTITNSINLRPETNSRELQWFPDDIFSYLKNIQMPGEEDYHYPSEVSIVHDINTTQIPSMKSYDRFYSIFGSNTSLCEYFIEFRNIQCRQLYKKTIDITNLMDVPTKFTVSVKNFKSKLFHRKRLDNILINMNWKADDKYTQQLSEYGIVVIVEPDTCDLKNKSNVTIELQVYAETWGFYLDEIGIEVENLPVFYFHVFIEVIGVPIEFPVNTNTLELAENIVRFGSRAVCSNLERRTIYFRNNCTIPYTIVWHVFVKNIEDYFKASINIVYDIFGFEDNDATDCKIRVLNYIGKESSLKFNIFEIEHHNIYIKPKETKTVNVSLNTEFFKNTNENIFVEGLLIGHIYIEDKYQLIKNGSNIVLRHPEKDLVPIKIHLTADIEPAELDLACIRGKRTMHLFVSDYLKESRVVANMRLVFKNTALFTVTFGVNIAEPFKVMAIRSACNESTAPDKNDMFTTVVHSDCCAEVLIQFLIDTELLLTISDVLYNDINHYMEDTAFSKNNEVKITKNLFIYQKCYIQQELPLSVTMVFPLTTVSDEILDFGQVCCGNEKIMTVKLRNKTASQTWYNAKLMLGTMFTVEPKKGYLDPIRTAEYSAYLTITFKPTDVGDYEDVLIVVTCVSQYEQEIKISGTGSNNEKYL